ncbi:MAG: polysaccharide export protein EpsE [Burkholderiales bacterium]|nr:polysaccharide export protein EpsE [Burkholderiales bacterium]
MFYRGFILFLLAMLSGQANADQPRDYRLGAGDSIHINVFRNPNLSLDARVSESGIITYPMLGTIALGGLTIDEAERKMAFALKKAEVVQDPQVNITLSQIYGSQVSVLGEVNKPGRFVLATLDTRVSDMLASAGGISQAGASVVILAGKRHGKPYRKVIDIEKMFLDDKPADDVLVEGGDAIYVDTVPTFYIYGEVNHPGSYRVARDMTVMQALAQGGGATIRGTEKGMKLYRRGQNGDVVPFTPELTDLVKNGDVLYIKESLF